jgi:chromate transporter
MAAAKEHMAEAAPAPPTFGEAARLWTRVGFLSFGGAAGQIAMLHRAVVDEKRWVDERRFLDCLSYCTLLPGPEAQQLATYLGFLLHGVRGGIFAGLMFVIPGAAIMLGLCFLYVNGRGLPLVDGLFLGIKAAVVAIIVEALIKIGRRAFRTRFLVAAAIACFILLVAFRVPFPVVIGGAAALGAILASLRPDLLALRLAEVGTQELKPVAIRAALFAAVLWTAVWWLPVGIAALTLGSDHLLVEIGLFFSKLAVITFGGAYAVLAYLADAAVNAKGWVSASEMVDGLGLAETTPGPTILVNQFAGFLAGWRNPAPFAPWAAATLGALMTAWVTFAPSFVWIFAGSPFIERTRASHSVNGALTVITAAVAGVVASLALAFGLNVLFARVGSWSAGPLILPLPQLSSLNLDAAALSILAAVMLFRLHRGVVATVAVLATAGAALSLIRQALGH